MRWVSGCARAWLIEPIQAMGRLVAPNLCEVCGAGAAEGIPLCTSCEAALPEGGSRRGASEALPNVFAYRYAGESAHSLLRRFKYGGATHLADLIGRAMARQWRRSGWGLAEAVLVPVPLSPGRFRERGYNQAMLLAIVVGDALGLPVLDLLRRVRPTRSQTRLREDARAANVRRAFAAKAASPRWPLVLVDDVWTTGATLRGCRDVLEGAGHTVAASATGFWTPPREAELWGAKRGDRLRRSEI